MELKIGTTNFAELPRVARSTDAFKWAKNEKWQRMKDSATKFVFVQELLEPHVNTVCRNDQDISQVSIFA